MSASQTEDLELIMWYYIRNEYENKFLKINVPNPLKYLMLSFSKRIIGSKLLTVKEDMEFTKLFLTKIPTTIKRVSLLFRATEDGFKAKDFHNKCDGKTGATVIIIQSNFGNIFGGYTTVPWTSVKGWQKDKNAFLFLVRSSNDLMQKQCPLLFNIKEDQSDFAVLHRPDYGPIFGRSDICIMNNCNNIAANNMWTTSHTHRRGYNYSHFKGSLCGDNLSNKNEDEYFFFQVLQYEMYQIHSEL